jgi:hypothetical protein
MNRIVLLALLLLWAIPAQAADMSGTYKGQLVSHGQLMPAKVTLNQVDGSVTGTYVFIERDETEVPGTLSNCRTNQMQLECTWRDKYGRGPVRWNFTSDFASFDGRWNGSYIWNGKK